MKNKTVPNSDMDFRIRFCQSWNLAVAILAPDIAKEPGSPEETKELLETWQKYFYDKLVTEPIDEANKAQFKRNPSEHRDNDELPLVGHFDDENKEVASLEL